MRKVYIILCSLLLLAAHPAISHAQNYLSMPESISFDSVRNRYLVTNIGNGDLVAIDTNGQQSVYLPGGGMLFGNCIKGDTLFMSRFTGNNTIFGIDLATGDTVLNLTLPGFPYCEGMTTDTSGNLYVVGEWTCIYKIDLSDHTYSVFVTDGLAPNIEDITFDIQNNRLLSVGWASISKIVAISLPDGATTELVTTPVGYLDGITMDHIGNMYITASDGGGYVYRYDRTFCKPPECISDIHVHPAGLDYNWRDQKLAVPNVESNSVDILSLTFDPGLDSYSFSDAAGGDGDGIFENGETVDVTATIINYRSQTCSGVTLSLSCDDAAITIVNADTYLGDMVSLDTADNIGDPLQFSIPADYNTRIDSLVLAISYNGGSEVDSFVIEQCLGAPRVLLVDDDDGASIEQYYIDVLSHGRIAYSVWNTPPAPDSSDLNKYEIVIWFTGDYRPPLDHDEIGAMTGYLDGGGNLFLTGQGIGVQLDMIDQDFLSNYLKADYLSTEFLMLLAPEPGGQVFTPSDTVLISGSGGADNQTDTDRLAAIYGGVGEMHYAASSELAAISYSGIYRLLFFGFGFEGIINGNDRWADRYYIFDRILDFFEYEKPSAAPEVSSLDIQPGDVTHLIDHTPEFYWTYYDVVLPQVQYQIQVGQNNDWSAAEMWDDGPMAGSGQQTVYGGLELDDGQQYYVRVRASNGLLWSDWLYGNFHMNSVPVPSGLVPDEMAELTEDNVVLVHDNLPDAEGDDITYSYEIYDDEEMTSLVVSASGQPAGEEATTAWEPSPVPPIENDYFWRVRAVDEYESGQWSPLASFWLGPAHICGDANGDRSVNVGDAVFLIAYVFKSGPAPDPECVGDANGDGNTNVGDAVYLIAHVFKGGPAPVEGCCPES